MPMPPSSADAGSGTTLNDVASNEPKPVTTSFSMNTGCRFYRQEGRFPNRHRPRRP